MKILLTGGAGQLGQALRQQMPAGITLITTSRSGDSAAGLLPLGHLAEPFELGIEQAQQVVEGLLVAAMRCGGEQHQT